MSLLLRLSLGTLLLLLSVAWVQVQELTTGGPVGRHEVIEYGLPFGWIIYDSAAGWYVSLPGLIGGLFAALSIVILVHCLRNRLEGAPRSGRGVAASMFAAVLLIAFFLSMLVYPEQPLP